MLVIFPIACLVVIYVSLTGFRLDRKQSTWQGNVLIAVVYWGILVAVIVEILGAFNLITQGALALVWGFFFLGASTVGWRRGWLQSGWIAIREMRFMFTGWQKGLLAGLAIILVVLFVVAVVAPPNNVDSLLYHMSRVMHWAQNRSLTHYATAYDHQLLKPPWAEMSILNLRVLWGNDQLVNLVQWTSMVGSIIGVTGIVALLGRKTAAQLLAAAFTISIPMGVLQATSTQNDYVAAFWVTCLAYFALLNHRRELNRLELFALAGAFGLGLLTKGTFYVYAPPFMIWFLIAVIRRSGLGTALRAGFAIGVVVFVLNIGFWSRNIVTYGGPFGTSDWLKANLTAGRSAQPVDQTLVRYSGEPDTQDGSGEQSRPNSTATEQATEPDPGVLDGRTPIEEDTSTRSPTGLVGWATRRIANLAALNLVTPSSAVNEMLRDALELVPALFGPDLFERMDQVAWSHEDSATNPLHLLFVPMSLGVLVILRPRNLRSIAIYAVACLAAYALVALIIGHGTTVWGLRYQLPFFVIWAPVVGVVFASIRPPAVSGVLSGLFLLAAIPWLLLNNMRPVIGMPPWPTRTESIFQATSGEIMLAIAPHALDSFTSVSEAILESGCDRVGLRMDSAELEYVVWWMLDAPQSGIQIKTIFTTPRLQHLIDQAFEPCAVVCTICEGDRVHGLPLVGERRPVGLYLGSGFVSDPEG